MFPESGMIELCGGRFDGYRKLLPYVPLSERLELRLPSSSLAAPPAAPRIAIYERRRTELVVWNHLPMVIYRYEFTGIKVRAPSLNSHGISGRIANLWHDINSFIFL
jgi:hypothetical protein